MSHDDDKLIQGHEYDGIHELDNPLPGWWLVTFYGTIIFAFLYYIHYTFTDAPTLSKELEISMTSIKAAKATASSVSISEDELSKQFTPEVLAQGKALYAAKCAACHAPAGGGLIGPNLTDSFWIHGKGQRADLYKIITEGVVDKGMPAWGEMLKSDELIAVVGYTHSLKGTNTPGGKPPQGNEVK